MLSLNSNIVELVGYGAAVLTTISFFPQVLKTWRSKSAGDLSVGMLLTFTVGVALWLIYGLALESIPVTVANALTLVQALFLLTLRLRFGSRP
jgi:MtN3 and saliva related transmembrane protein